MVCLPSPGGHNWRKRLESVLRSTRNDPPLRGDGPRSHHHTHQQAR